MSFVANVACAFLACGLLHSLSRRLAARACSHAEDLCPADAWMIYFVIFFSGLVVSFHAAGAAALATGYPLVHIATVTGVLAVLWSVDRLLLGLQRETGMLSYAGAWRGMHDALRSVDRLVRWSALAAGSIGVLFLLETATRPPEGWDAMVYHLPLAMKWLQRGSLAFIEESWKFQMPSNGELFPLFLTYFGNERLLSLANLPFAVLAMLAVYSLAWRALGSFEGALLAALGFGTMPIVLYNTFSVGVDIFAASFFLVSVVFLLALYQQEPQACEARLLLGGIAGLAFGLGLGARYIYVPLFLLMTGLCVLLSLTGLAPLRGGKWTRAVLTTGTFVAGSLLPSAFWYIRNWGGTGNPMYPLEFSVGAQGIKVSTKALSEYSRIVVPRVQDPGFCLVASDHTVTHWLMAPWEDCWIAGLDHYSENWGLGAVFTAFVPVMSIAAVFLSLAALVRRRQVQPLHILLLVAAVFLAYWWLKLFTIARSILPVMGILFVLVAFGIATLSRKAQRVAYGLFVCAMIANGVLLAAKPIEALGSRVFHQNWSHSRYYKIPQLIDELPAGSVILNASDEMKNYPLFGRHWQNRVITDRALIEPAPVTVIGDDFLRKWGVEYVYYDTGQKWTLGDEVKREVLYEHVRDESAPYDSEILYRIIR
ncbi:MAG: hypothetical protein RI101_00060 [Nitrospira sp.]|jgi:hypothetical protein|nr:hypothetical protein [Nitrospira sp.]